MTTSLKIRLTLALLLLGGGAYLHQHPAAADSIVAAVRSPLSIFGVKGTVVQAWIVEESSLRSKLDQRQIIAIRKAETLGIKLVDPNDVPTTAAAPRLTSAPWKEPNASDACELAQAMSTTSGAGPPGRVTWSV